MTSCLEHVETDLAGTPGDEFESFVNTPRLMAMHTCVEVFFHARRGHIQAKGAFVYCNLQFLLIYNLYVAVLHSNCNCVPTLYAATCDGSALNYS